MIKIENPTTNINIQKKRGRPKGSTKYSPVPDFDKWETGWENLGINADLNPSLLLFRQIDRVGEALSKGELNNFINSVEQLYGLLSPNFDEEFKKKDEEIIKENKEIMEKIKIQSMINPNNYSNSITMNEIIFQQSVSTAKKRFWALMELISRLSIWFEQRGVIYI